MTGDTVASMVTDTPRDARRRRARLSLEGLSVGDAFGETFFGPSEIAVDRITGRELRPPPWRWTDDSEMAFSIVAHLEERETIDQDELAKEFATQMDPTRGYGAAAFDILSSIRDGQHWRIAAGAAFRGRGSFGNGAAMRVAPLGAYFADDLDRVVDEAARSAEVTHAHPEGIAGAVAVAVAAAALASPGTRTPRQFLEDVLARVPRGYTYDGVKEALSLPNSSPIEAATVLGNGSGVTAPDTVPFCLWVVAHYLDRSYEEALWATVSALGDRDTTCAIVGGILVLRTGRGAIPRAWHEARELLPDDHEGTDHARSSR